MSINYNFNKLTPFKWFVLQNFPFIDEDFDAITNYQLFCKLGEEINKVIESQNLVGEQVEVLTNAFNDLYDYVNNYFENLDVQEEINNKLDEMAEQGTLQTLILSVLNSKAILTYNTINDLKTSENIVKNSVAHTLGFYSKNDGGEANYIIREKTENDIEDNAFIHFLQNNLVAELLIKDNTINILQLGAKADNETDNQPIFTLAMKSGFKILVPEKENPYLLKFLGINENVTIEGIGFPQINIKRENSNETTSYIMSNSRMKNLNIQCQNENMVWSRFAINNADNVQIENCHFEGFRDLSQAPNAWGLILNGATNFKISNCTFENNSQSDLAIENNNSNGVIEHCSGSNFVVNFEANQNNNLNENITIKDCVIAKLFLLAYSNVKWDFKNINILNCPIDHLYYRGANANLINSPVKSAKTSSYYMALGGELQNINSLYFGENINNDPYFMNIVPSSVGGDKWIVGYSAGSNMINAYKTQEKGRYLSLNPSNINHVISIKKEITVKPDTTYAIRTLMNTKTVGTLGVSGRGIQIQFYNAVSESWDSTIYVSPDRNNTPNSESPFTEKTIILTTPVNCNKIRITLCNNQTDRTSYNQTNFARLLFSEVLNEPREIEQDTKSYSDLPNSTNISSIGTNSGNVVGDKLYCNDLSQNTEGYICIARGNGNINTWKKFGAFTE